MRRGMFIGLLAAVIAVTAGTASATSTQRTAGTNATTAGVTRIVGLEALVLREVNAVRAAHGVRKLRSSNALVRAAASHSNAMIQVGFFAHESADGTSFGDRVVRFYPSRGRPWSAGENLAMFGFSAPTPRRVVAAWMSSPAHRDNLLAAQYRDAGLAIAYHPAAGGVFSGAPTWVVTLDLGFR